MPRMTRRPGLKPGPGGPGPEDDEFFPLPPLPGTNDPGDAGTNLPGPPVPGPEAPLPAPTPEPTAAVGELGLRPGFGAWGNPPIPEPPSSVVESPASTPAFGLGAEEVAPLPPPPAPNTPLALPSFAQPGTIGARPFRTVQPTGPSRFGPGVPLASSPLRRPEDDFLEVIRRGLRGAV
jgi:hypothetical protein